MKKLKLQPLANAKKLSRKELKNIFGGFGDSGLGSGNGNCNLYVASCYIVTGNGHNNAYKLPGGGWNCCK